MRNPSAILPRRTRRTMTTMPPGLESWWGTAEPEIVGEAPAVFAEAFARSMPPRYAVLFDPRSIRKHAGIACRRGARAAHAEVWRELADGTAALCVVAEDRPGLLSAIAAALVSHRLDVITALVFSRATPAGQLEAVDLVWVRRADPADAAPIGPDEATSIGEVLSAILSGSISVEEIASRATTVEPHEGDDTVVRFEGADEDGHAVLLVEAPDRPGILLTIAFEVFQQGAQILRSLVRTAEQRAFNRFVLAEFNGAPLSQERREQIRAAVLSALSLRAP
jgi:[protein-PII] uridylyltransferase